MGGSQNSLLKNSGAGNGAGNSSGGVATHKGPDEDKVGVLSILYVPRLRLNISYILILLNRKVREILERTGYKLDVTTGQRKYGGPPPGTIHK